jgi:hypothetical protein
MNKEMYVCGEVSDVFCHEKAVAALLKRHIEPAMVIIYVNKINDARARGQRITFADACNAVVARNKMGMTDLAYFIAAYAVPK